MILRIKNLVYKFYRKMIFYFPFLLFFDCKLRLNKKKSKILKNILKNHFISNLSTFYLVTNVIYHDFLIIFQHVSFLPIFHPFNPNYPLPTFNLSFFLRYIEIQFNIITCETAIIFYLPHP